MKKSKYILPEKHVEYTFAISGKFYKRIFLDSAPTSTGEIRLFFQDVKDDYVSDMSVWQFNEYRRKHQIRKERRLEGYVAQAEPSKPIKATEGEQEFWKDVTKRVRNIPEAHYAYVVELIGYSPLKLADEMDNLDNGLYTKEYEYRVMRNVKLVSEFLDKYDFSSEEVQEPEKASPTTLIALLKSIPGSMAQKCRARFGYSIYDLVDKLKELGDKNGSYAQSIYKETYRVLEYAGCKTPTSLSTAVI